MRKILHVGTCLSLALSLILSVHLFESPAYAKKEKKKKEKDPFAASTGGVFLYSRDMEVKLGQEVKQEVLKEYKLYEDPELVGYVRKVGKKLAEQADRQNVEYEFFVLDDPLVNAFALPGGTIYITRGILTVFNNEAELAGVLGHEIGHVVERHSMKHMQGARALELLWMVGTKGERMPLGYQIAADLLVFKPYGRGDELRSDALGIKYSYMAGYQADRVAHVFEEFQKREKFKMPEFLRSHPVDARRIEQVRDLWTLIQTRTDIKPGAQPLATNTDEYARIVHPHTYRKHYPEVRAVYDGMLEAMSRKDIEGVMRVVHKKFKSDWLKMDREKLQKHYETRFAAVDKLTDTAVFSEYRVLDKDAIGALCSVSESVTYPDGRAESGTTAEVVYFVKNETKDTEGPEWKLIGIEDGGKW